MSDVAAALVCLVAVDTAVTGWLLSQLFVLRRTVVQLGEIVASNSHDIETICVQIGTVDG